MIQELASATRTPAPSPRSSAASLLGRGAYADSLLTLSSPFHYRRALRRSWSSTRSLLLLKLLWSHDLGPQRLHARRAGSRYNGPITVHRREGRGVLCRRTPSLSLGETSESLVASSLVWGRWRKSYSQHICTAARCLVLIDEEALRRGGAAKWRHDSRLIAISRAARYHQPLLARSLRRWDLDCASSCNGNCPPELGHCVSPLPLLSRRAAPRCPSSKGCRADDSASLVSRAVALLVYRASNRSLLPPSSIVHLQQSCLSSHPGDLSSVERNH